MKAKYIFEFNDDDNESKRAIEQALINYNIVNNLYDDVFRSVIKYSEDELQVKYYYEVWLKISELIND